VLVLAENAAEAVASVDVQVGEPVWVGDRFGQLGEWPGVRDALVWPVLVVEDLVFAQRVQQMPLLPNQRPVEQFASAGAHPAFDQSVHARHLDAAPHDRDAGVGEDRVEQGRVPAVPIPDEVLHAAGRVVRQAINEMVDAGLLDHLMARVDADGLALTGQGGLLPELVKAVLERGLAAELTDHLGYEKGDPAGRGSSNSRNGNTPKTLATEVGDVRLEVPRDRAGSFEPRLVPKGSRRAGGLDEMIISLYAGGMTVRDIQHHLARTLGTDLSHDTISKITDAVADEVKAWQHRPLEERRFLLVVANPEGTGFGCPGVRPTRCRWRSSAATSS
jgi:hypothetical protein